MVGQNATHITMRIIIYFLMLLIAGCGASQIMVAPLTPSSPILAGVDSIQVEIAWKLAEESFPKDAKKAADLAEEGRELADLANQLIKPAPESTTRDTVQAFVSFNEGAVVLDQLSDADSLQALMLLETAAEKFEDALEADAFDDLARQWLAQVYELLAVRFRQSGAIEDQLRVLERLILWNQDRHDFIAQYAEAHEGSRDEESAMKAGALWDHAAQVALDDVEMGFHPSPDSAALFAYHVRASRAFILADRGSLARASLSKAMPWQRTSEERALIHADSLWLAWDGGNLRARKRFDSLLSEASLNPEKAAEGLRQLLGEVQSGTARVEMQHQLALATYASGSEQEAAEFMQHLVTDNPDQSSLVADYAVMTYNIAQKHRQLGDLRSALAYLLQCASLGAPIAVRAAFDVAFLLRNNHGEAIKYAHMAEVGIDMLDRGERISLIQYLAELYRRTGDRERAREYILHLEDAKQN